MTRVNRMLCNLLILIATTLCLSVLVHGQAPDVKTKATASISGRVTVGEKPAPGIVVGVGKTLAVSDADGRYRISGLTEGELIVIPFAPLYVVPSGPMLGAGKSVNVAAGEAVDGIDFKLTKGAVISGRITDGDGRPVIEESVRLLAVDENGNPSREQSPRMTNFQMYQTDDRGNYRIYGLPAGHYKVSAGDEAGRVAGLFTSGYYEQTFYPDATDQAKATMVDLNEGGEAKNIDIKLGRRATAYTVTGRIVDADTGEPLPGVRFGFGVVQKNQNYIAGTASPGAPTNSQGEFRLEGVLPGKYAVFVSEDRNPFFSPNDSPKIYSDPVPFEVIDGDVTNLEVKAQRGVTLTGVVVPDGISNKQVLARIMNLRIVANMIPNPNSMRVLTMSRFATVAADGSFQIEGLAPGRVSLYLTSANGDSRGFSITRTEQNGVVQNQGVELQPGQNATGVRVFLTYGTSVIRGQLKVEGGTLPSNGMMLVTARREGPGGSGAQVDARGQFVIKNLPAGTYTVEIHVMGLTRPSPEILSQLRQTVTVADDSESQVLFTLNLSPKEGP
jgi:protocatechuate 3,4-dioxygenase beta subunit